MGGGKEKTQSRTWVSSKRKKGEVCDTFLAFCASVGYCERVFERNSHKVTRNADSSSHVDQPGLWVHTSEQSTFPQLLLNALSCRLPRSLVSYSLSLSGTFIPSFSSGLSRKLFVWVSRQNRQRDPLSDTHTHRNECHPSRHNNNHLCIHRILSSIVN